MREVSVFKSKWHSNMLLITSGTASVRASDFTKPGSQCTLNSLSTSNLPSEKLIYNSQMKTKIPKSTLSVKPWKKTHGGRLNFHHHKDLLFHLFAFNVP